MSKIFIKLTFITSLFFYFNIMAYVGSTPEEVFKIAAGIFELNKETVKSSANNTNNTQESGQVKQEREKCLAIVGGRNLLLSKSQDWLYVPKGICDKIHSGNFNDIPEDIKQQLDLSHNEHHSAANQLHEEPLEIAYSEGILNTVSSWFN